MDTMQPAYLIVIILFIIAIKLHLFFLFSNLISRQSIIISIRLYFPQKYCISLRIVIILKNYNLYGNVWLESYG